MPVDPDQLVDFLAELAEEEGLVVAAKESAKAAVAAGAGAFIGGLVAGPPGIVIGE